MSKVLGGVQTFMKGMHEMSKMAQKYDKSSTESTKNVWTATRKICNVFGPTVTKIIADCIVPFLGVLPTQSRMSLKNSTWKQCREIILVNIDPFILHCFRHSEVKNWFKNNDCEIVENLPSSPIAIWGESAKTFYSQE